MNELENMVREDRFIDFRNVFRRNSENKEFRRNIWQMYNRYSALSKKFFDLNPDELNRLAFVVSAACVSRGLAMSQIRKILNLINSIKRNIDKSRDKDREYDISKDRMKLKYMLAYITASHQGKIEPFMLIVSDDVIPKLTPDNFPHFYDFVQAMVAYHKFLGGKD